MRIVVMFCVLLAGCASHRVRCTGRQPINAPGAAHARTLQPEKAPASAKP